MEKSKELRLLDSRITQVEMALMALLEHLQLELNIPLDDLSKPILKNKGE